MKFLMLFKFTDQGRENINESPARVKALQKFQGCTVLEQFYTTTATEFDTLFIVEAEYKMDVIDFARYIEQAGNVTAKWYPLLSVDQFADILTNRS